MISGQESVPASTRDDFTCRCHRAPIRRYFDFATGQARPSRRRFPHMYAVVDDIVSLEQRNAL